MPGGASPSSGHSRPAVPRARRGWRAGPCPGASRAAAAGSSSGAERSGPGGSRPGLSGTALGSALAACAPAKELRDGPGKSSSGIFAARSGVQQLRVVSILTGLGVRGLWEGKGLDEEPRAAVACLYSCSQRAGVCQFIWDVSPLKFFSESFVSPAVIVSGQTMYQSSCPCNCAGRLKVLTCFLGSF